MSTRIRVTIWNEYRHEIHHERVKQIYPDGIHMTIKRNLSQYADFKIRTAILDSPEHGLTYEVLSNTEVLLWWGHIAHEEVSDEIVDRVHRRVLEGMGLIVLHSGHFSKIFRNLLGTTCSLKWREIGEKERIWNIEPSHPIAEGIGDYFELPHAEMYGERFDIPTPERLVFVSWFAGGEVFRSGCCWERGHGRLFYFKPGHETYPIFENHNVIRILANAVRWARPRIIQQHRCSKSKPLEKII